MAYLVVPFVANIQKGQGPDAAAGQLAELINTQSRAGWRYLRMENAEIIIRDPGSSGCMGIFGVVPPSSSVTRYDMVVFESEE